MCHAGTDRPVTPGTDNSIRRRAISSACRKTETTMTTNIKTPLLIGALFALAPFAKADDISQLKADVAALQNIVNNQQTTINQLSSTAAMLVKKTQFITI